MVETVTQGGEELAAAPSLLARWWSRPTEAEREAWEPAWPAAHDAARSLGAEGGVLALETAASEAVPERLLEEYERLLVGPGRAPCPPYESLWSVDQPRREQGRLMGATAVEVVRIYGDLGLAVRHDAHELPDHLAVECEALAYAHACGRADAAGALAAHLAAWTPSFCAAVATETAEPFYASLAAVTAAWVAALAG